MRRGWERRYRFDEHQLMSLIGRQPFPPSPDELSLDSRGAANLTWIDVEKERKLQEGNVEFFEYFWHLLALNNVHN